MKSSFFAASLLYPLLLISSQSISLAPLEVSQKRVSLPTKPSDESVYTGTELTKKGMSLGGERAKSSVYESLAILSGVNVESADSSGLAVEQGSVRFRGVRSYMGAISVGGVPNYGGNPIGPRDYLYDTENIDSISIYKGAIPGSIGVGVGSRGGAVELRPKWADEKFGVLLSQALGSNSFQRTFVRVDSGRLNESKSRFSASFSFADADKWRGEGGVGERTNANISFVQPVGEKLTVKAWFNHNNQKQHLYRPLSFAELSGGNLGANYKKDFNSNLTGTAATDVYYYDYNRGDYKNDDYIASLEYRTEGGVKVTLKPYYNVEDSVIYQGNTNAKVQKRVRDIVKQGVLAELQGEFAGVNAVAGYHYEISDMNIYTQNYTPKAKELVYNGYGVFATTGKTYVNSPYIKLAGAYADFKWQAGLKYFKFEDSDSEGYITGPAPAYAPIRAKDLDRDGDTHTLWIPSVGFSYQLTDSAEARVSYGKSFIRPYAYLPLVSTYNTYRSQFQSAGVTVADLFKGYRLEESDSVDVGIRYFDGFFDLSPTFFYAKHKNLLTNISDNRIIVGGKPLSYQQNVGKATAYGVEMESNLYLNRDLSVFVNPTLIKMVYDKDLSYKGAVKKVKSKQVVDTPQFSAKAGAIYKAGAFEIVPMLRFTGARYGDAEHNEKVDAYTIADLKLSYKTKAFYGFSILKISAEVNNLFDKKYISVINASDDNRAGAASFYQGAPRSFALTAEMKF